MLKLNGFGKLAINLSPTGLAVGTRQVHYAWVIVAIAAIPYPEERSRETGRKSGS